MTVPVELVDFPDAAALVVAYVETALAAHGSPVPVATEIPPQRPPVFVRAWRSGGRRLNVGLDAPQITVQCWARTDAAAADLARLTRTLIERMPEYGDEIGGPAYYPDDTGAPRYQFTIQLVTAAQPLP